MDNDTAVLGGETPGPAADWFGNRTTVSFFLNQRMRLSSIDAHRDACQVSHSILNQPIASQRCEILQASPSTKDSVVPVSGDLTLFLPFPSFPQAPARLFGRDAILDDLLGFAARSASVTLFGAGGMGKTSIALTLLRHHEIVDKFGKYRYLMRCDDLENSLGGFIEGLSEVVGAPEPTDTAKLLSHLESFPCILVLDGIDSILDPLAPGTAEIAKTIAEFGLCPKVFVLATSRIDAKITGFRNLEVSTFSEEAARCTFHSCCRFIEISAAVDNVLAELDFHPLSIALLASAVNESEWDEPALLRAWGDGKTCILKASGRESLEDYIGSILRAPSIQELGITAWETLEAIANSPGDIQEIQLLILFPGISKIGKAVNALCKYSMLYRQDGFVMMLAPFRLYFQHSRRVADSGLSLSSHLLHVISPWVCRHPTRGGPAGQTRWWEYVGAGSVSLLFSFPGLEVTLICS